MGVYTLNNTTVTPIFPSGYTEALTIANTGQYPAVVGSDPMASDQIPVAPGASLVWDQGRPLYAQAQTPFGATINVYPNAGTPAPTVVSGQPDTLLWSTSNTPSLISVQSPITDVSLFTTLICYFMATAAGLSSSINQVTFDWFLADGTTQISQDVYYPIVLPKIGGSYSAPIITIPVVASKVRLTVTGNSPGLTANLFGSNRAPYESMDCLIGRSFYDLITNSIPIQINSRRAGSIIWSDNGIDDLYINGLGRYLTLTLVFSASITAAGSYTLQSYAPASLTGPDAILRQAVPIVTGSNTFSHQLYVPLGTILVVHQQTAWTGGGTITVTATFSDQG